LAGVQRGEIDSFVDRVHPAINLARPSNSHLDPVELGGLERAIAQVRRGHGVAGGGGIAGAT
jgi:hypothetical protein